MVSNKQLSDEHRLLNHLTDKHPRHVDDYKEYERGGCKSLDTFAATLLHPGSKRSHVTANKATYEPLLFHILPMSNDCERLFSKARAVLTPQRRSMLPVNFEMIMFLKENDSYWSRRTIAEVQQSSIDIDTISGN
ncbi:Hypothetical protein PHPALM_18351 [Phytophthora palmivora]|uniref:HAT C-terminal dimerisation domain-containing protein n=1 Tax=Phytophthora palmivora TaxID=4796 RepID=A0A2P4XJY9_9STRA|nr:Hypothetical protein PHPALM_18351 [Phytophthora palmivora]